MARRAAITLAAALALAACGGDGGGSDPMDPGPGNGPGPGGGGGGPYHLTFQGDGTFAGRAGAPVYAALHLKSTNEKLDVQQATVGTGSPAFSVTFAPTLDPATQYHLHYWIDVDGDGLCEPLDVDYGWAVDPPKGVALFVESERDPEVSDVCGSFPPP
jgi:hypothetical protein